MPSSEMPRRWSRLLGLLVISYVICVSGFVLRATLSRSSHWDGVTNGLFFSMFFVTIPWLIIVVPLTIACDYAQLGSGRLRTLVVLAPSLFAFFLILLPLLTSPPTAANRFLHLTQHALPASASGVRVHDVGGGFDGTETTFFFRCTATDTDGLIQALDLQRSDDQNQTSLHERGDATWPDPRQWEGRTLYRKERPSVESGPRPPGQNYRLSTDATRTQVYFTVSP